MTSVKAGRGPSALSLAAAVVVALGGSYCMRQAPARPPVVASVSEEGGPTRVELIAAGQQHSCAVLDDGSLRCWGADHSGQLGVVPLPSLPDGTRGSATPLPAFVLDQPSALSLGVSQTCLLNEDGTVRCVGERIHLEESRKAPQAPLTLDTEPVQALSAGSGMTCLLLDSGRATCLGKQALAAPLRGATGSTTPGRIELASVDDEQTFKAIGCGNDVCAVTEAGAVRCWRSTDQFREGEAGGNVEELALPAPAEAISVSFDFGGCALLETHAVHCWNGAAHGAITVTRIALDGPARQVESGGFFSCAVLESGELRCWGREEYFKALARPVAPGVYALDVGGRVRMVAVGELHACVLLERGAVRCFGHNSSGQLGYGHQRDIGDDEPLPGDVPVLGRPAAIRAWQAPPPSASTPPLAPSLAAPSNSAAPPPSASSR